MLLVAAGSNCQQVQTAAGSSRSQLLLAAAGPNCQQVRTASRFKMPQAAAGSNCCWWQLVRTASIFQLLLAAAGSNCQQVQTAAGPNCCWQQQVQTASRFKLLQAAAAPNSQQVHPTPLKTETDSLLNVSRWTPKSPQNTISSKHSSYTVQYTVHDTTRQFFSWTKNPRQKIKQGF